MNTLLICIAILGFFLTQKSVHSSSDNEYDCTFTQDLCSWSNAVGTASQWEIKKTNDGSKALEAPFSTGWLTSKTLNTDFKCIIFMYSKTGVDSMLTLQTLDSNNEVNSLFENDAGENKPVLKKTVHIPIFHNVTGLTFQFVGSSYKPDNTYMWLYYVKFSKEKCRTSEEPDYFNCNFTKDFCLWESSKVHSWNIVPKKGFAQAPNSTAALLRSPQLPSIVGGCITFTYTQRNQYDFFEVVIEKNALNGHVIYHGVKGYRKTVSIPINMPDLFWLDFKGQGSVSLYDVKLSSYACDNQKGYKGYGCTFESGFCNWHQSGMSIKKNKGKFTATSDVMDSYLISPEFKISERGYCLYIQFQLNGYVDIIKQVNGSDSLLTRKQSGNKKSKYLRQTYTAEEKFQMKISFETGEGRPYLYEIKVTPGACDGSVESCSFQPSKCGYKKSGSKKSPPWKLTHSLEVSQKTLYDHTIGSDKGQFLSLRSHKKFSLKAPPIKMSGRSFCLRFWYCMSYSTMYINQNKHRGNLWSHATSKGVLEWQVAEVNMTEKPFYFRGQITANGFVALDDLSLFKDACSNVCKFTQNTCTWLNMNQNFKWKIGTGENYMLTGGASSDYSGSSETGGYLYLDQESKHAVGDKARLRSQYLRRSNVSRCLNMYFFMNYMDGLSTLNVYSQSKGGNETLLWSFSEYLMEPWNEAHVPIENFEGYMIVEGIYGLNLENTICLINLGITDGSCKLMPEEAFPVPSTIAPPTTSNPKVTSLYDCNFDEPASCSWKKSHGRYGWNVATHDTFVKYGPKIGHGSRFSSYAYIDQTYNSAEFMCLKGVKRGTNCINFQLYIGGIEPPKFSVVAGSSSSFDTFFQLPYDFRTDIWALQKVTITERKNHEICFKGTTTKNTDGVIAVDEIVVKHGACVDNKTDPFQLCTFDQSGKCGYQSTSNWKFSTNYSITSGRKDLGLAAFVQGPQTSNSILQSPSYTTAYSGHACLSFFSMLHFEGLMKINIVADGKTTTIKTVNGSEIFHYEKNYMLIEADFSDDEFTIQIVVAAMKAHELVAVDNIRVIKGVCPSKGFCNFEKNQCNWMPDENDNAHWMRSQGSQYVTTGGPAFDNTLQSSDGHYMHVSNDDPGKKGTSANLVSEVFENVQHGCLNFYYHSSRIQIGTLKVKLRHDNFHSTLWIMDYDIEVWNIASVPVPPYYDTYQLVFEIIFNGETGGDIAIDDISFTSTSCKIRPIISEPTYSVGNKYGNCKFDNGTLCRWTTSLDSSQPTRQSWKFGSRYSRVPYGPEPTLNEKNQYLYQDPTQSMSNLYSPILPPSKEFPLCLSFSYFIFGQATMSLFVKTMAIDKYGKPNEQVTEALIHNFSADRWYTMKRTLHSQRYDYKIAIMARCYELELGGAIAVDNIALIDGDCTPSDFCDFEVDSCQWSNTNGSNWLRKSPRNDDKSGYISNDHTTGTLYGYFYVVSEPDTTNELASPLYNADSGPQCLSFWHAIEGTATNDTLRIILELHDKTVVLHQTALKLKMSDSNPYWSPYQANLNSQMNFKIIFQAKIGAKSSIKIHIDDVKVSPGVCPPATQCNFDESFCSFSMPDETDFMWLLGHGRVRNPDLITAPKRDHTSGLGMYAYVDLTSAAAETEMKAILQTHILKNTKVSCVEFYYVAYGPQLPILTLKKALYNENYFSYKKIWSSPKHSIDVWTHVKLQISVDQDFRIAFYAEDVTGPRGMIAIDDFSYKIGKCSTEIKPPTNALDKCTFGSGFCQWSFATKNRWSISNETEIVEYQPEFSYPRGKYAFVNSHSDDTAVYDLISTPLLIPLQSCFTFWYYIFGPQVGRLSVVMTDSSNKMTVLWIRNGSRGDNWHQGFVQLQGKSDHFQVHLRVKTSSRQHGVIAIDDPEILYGYCDKAETDLCTFDDNDRCNFSQDISNQVFWKLGQANVINNIVQDIPPFFDHTTRIGTGGVMFIQLNYQHDFMNYRTKLLTPVHKATEQSCLKFWFWHSDDMDSTIINILMSKNGLVGNPLKSFHSIVNYWEGAQVDIKSDTSYQIVFEVTYDGSSFESVIAIDDVEISDGFCTDPGSCDFENNNCLWKLERNVVGVSSLRMYALDPVNVNGPAADVTLGTGEGHFLYYKINNVSYQMDNIQLMESEIITSVGIHCFSFWIYKISGNVVNLQIRNLANYLSQNINFNISRKWVKQEHQLHYVDRNFKIGIAITPTSNSEFALDDLVVSEGACPSERKIFDCGNGQHVEMMHVCNWVKDCFNGFDEKNCGNCDFETGLCGWTAQKGWDVEKSQWKRRLFNHSKNWVITSEGFTYNFMSPIMQPASGSCYVELAFYAGNITGLRVNLVQHGEVDYNDQTDTVTLWNMASVYSPEELRSYSYARSWRSLKLYIGHVRNPFHIELDNHCDGDCDLLSIDNINFLNCYPQAQSACTTTEFHCKVSKACIPRSSYCDFVDDCGDGSDEEDCAQKSGPRCDFESSLCSWETNSNSSNIWLHSSVSHFNSNIGTLARDHTTGSTTGHFVALVPNVFSFEEEIAFMYSPIFKKTSTCRMRLFLAIAADDDASTNSYIIVKTKSLADNSVHTVWSSKNKFFNTTINTFFKETFVFHQKYDFQVIIEGHENGRSIAVDDIALG